MLKSNAWHKVSGVQGRTVAQCCITVPAGQVCLKQRMLLFSMVLCSTLLRGSALRNSQRVHVHVFMGD
jgi:hypothetical protein